MILDSTIHYVTLRYVTIIMEADDDEHITRTTSYRQANKQITKTNNNGRIEIIVVQQ